MPKIRVYELARELGKDNKAMEEFVRGLGIEIKNYMSTLSRDEADQVRRMHSGGDAAVANRKATPIRRKGAPRPAEMPEPEPTPPPSPRSATPEVVLTPQTSPPQPAGGPTVVRRVAPRSAVESTSEPVVGRPSEAPSSSAKSSTTDALPKPEPRVVREVSPAAPPQKVPRPNSGPVRPSGTQVKAPSISGETSPSVPVPAVGTRIALPPGTRRLPGGLANRGPSSAGAAVDAPASVAVVSRVPSAPTPVPASTSGATVSRTVAAAGGQAGLSTADASAARRVLRNEEGVIVGATSQRSEPTILGFIPLEQRKRPQQVIITDASEEDRRGRASQRKQREERVQAQGRRKKMTVRGGRRGGMPTRLPTTEMSEAKRRVRVDEAIIVGDLAHQMGQKSANLLKVLWGMGLRGITINSALDAEMAELVAAEFGYTVENVSFQEQRVFGQSEGDEIPRAPVVTVMGHVDHGKTSLLDRIRSANVAAGEAGGITQHIGAYKVHTPKGEVVFLDTPGHEAFTAMRARGAQITDVVVLVIAADDGIMPTTVEAIKHAREAGVPTLVAINKVDKPDANPGRVKQALMEHGLVGEEFGGDTIICEVSAKTGQGIEQLLEMLAVQSELLDLRAQASGHAQGTVVEARIDKGRGPIATVLVDSGMLRKGDTVVANEFTGKVRTLFSDTGDVVDEAGPSTPVEVHGLDGVPAAGDKLVVVENDRAAKQLVQHRRELRRRKESVRVGPSIHDLIQRKKTPSLKVVLRADVHGTAEALKRALEDLTTDKVKVEVIFSGVGAINETDVKYAQAGEAVILGFNVRTAGKAAQAADTEKIQILTHTVIYEALDRIKELMVELLEPEYREKEQGEAEVRALFPIPRLGVVAGCRIIRGLVQRSSRVRVVRGGDIVHKGHIASLRVFKDDVREVREGFECGIVVDGFGDVRPGDIIQSFEVETIAPTL